jgi:hypothetical protein
MRTSTTPAASKQTPRKQVARPRPPRAPDWSSEEGRALKIFVSHNTDYHEIAKTLRLGLQALESKFVLRVMLCEEIQGSTEWETWIRESISSADLFVLLYPHEYADLTWCTYERALFDASGKPGSAVVCIKNPELPPPKLFEKYQAYDANAANLRKFLFEVFADGAFTGTVPVNHEVAVEGTRFYVRAKEVAQEIEEQFNRARLRSDYFEKRIRISLPESSDMLDAAYVDGNEVALGLLAVGNHMKVGWPVVRDLAKRRGARWPTDIEAALPDVKLGLLPPPLSPFRAKDVIYIPVISRTENVNGHLRSIYVIFVEVDVGKLGPMLGESSAPVATPEGWEPLLALLKNMIHVRWDVLEPAVQKSTLKTLSVDAKLENARQVVASMDQMAAEWQSKGGGMDKFRSTFDRSLQDDVKKLLKDWGTAFDDLTDAVQQGNAGIHPHLERLLVNNASWFRLTARQLDLLAQALQ